VKEALILQNPNLEGQLTYEPVGCVTCAGKGYVGRIGLFELFDCDSESAKLIAQNVNQAAVAQQSLQRGGRLLLDDGLAKILDGTTSLSEVVAAVDWGSSHAGL
jgi:type II secretory ATPase GspE/PulE/Tfp pilus assembly ATPase PilB-like protein